jgi:hypothetical protein
MSPRTYLIDVDYSWKVKDGEANGNGLLVISIPALGGMLGPIAFAFTKGEVEARARDLLILFWRELDDEYAGLAYMELRWIYQGQQIPSPEENRAIA